MDEGTTVRFTCKVAGLPKPTLTLYKDGEKLTESNQNNRVTLEQGEHGEYSLVIENIMKSDEALYRCKAENDEGCSTCALFVEVKGIPVCK